MRPELGEPLIRLAPDSIVLNDWTARELNAKAGDTATLDFYLWDANAGLRTQHRRLHRRRHRADDRTGRRSAARASLPGHHRFRQPVRLGSAVPARPLESAPARRSVLARPPHDTEGVHPLRARARFVVDPLRRAHRPSLRRAPRRERGRAGGGAASAAAAAGRAGLAGHRADAGATAGARSLARRHRLRRVLHLLQLLHRRLGAAARGAVLPARRRTAAAPDRRAASHRVYRASSPPDAARPRPR